jgi:hypothetical protein
MPEACKSPQKEFCRWTRSLRMEHRVDRQLQRCKWQITKEKVQERWICVRRISFWLCCSR